jgi:hypothetical protein
MTDVYGWRTQAMATDNHFSNSKYTLMCMDLSSGPPSSLLAKARRAELGQLITGSKAYEDLCAGFGVDVDRARVETVEEILAQGTRMLFGDDMFDDGDQTVVDGDGARSFIAKVEAAAAATTAANQSISSSFLGPDHERQAVAI